MRAFRVAYDGNDYHGFQRQPTVKTVEGQLLKALAQLDIMDGPETVPPEYAAAGRTDAGVSALAQTVAFDAPDWLDPRALNSQLPADIRAWASAPAPDSFHATHDATARKYEYWLHAPEADPSVAEEAMGRLAGRQDVRNLTLDEKGTDRVLDPAISVAGECLVLTFRAGGFPRQFVRRAVELVREVATGESDVDKVDRILDPTPVSGPEGVPPASPTPLLLLDVEYPALSFRVDETAARSTREIFRDRRAKHLARARVAEQIASVGKSADE
jgi:tRNA pseudouridine38-40 synthase